MYKMFGGLEGKGFEQLNYKGNHLIPIIQLFQQIKKEDLNYIYSRKKD